MRIGHEQATLANTGHSIFVTRSMYGDILSNHRSIANLHRGGNVFKVKNLGFSTQRGTMEDFTIFPDDRTRFNQYVGPYNRSLTDPDI